MKVLLHLLLAAMLFAAGISSESHSSDLLRITGDGWYTWQVEGADDLEIHARFESGHLQEFIIPRFQCGHRRLPESTDLGVIDAGESIAWLRRFITPQTSISNEVLFVIVAHDNDEAFAVIDELLFD